MDNIKLIRDYIKLKRPDLIIKSIEYNNVPEHQIEGYRIIKRENGKDVYMYLCMESVDNIKVELRQYKLNSII